MKNLSDFVLASLGALAALVLAAGCASTAPELAAAPGVTDGWRQVQFGYEIQHPYDLKTFDRYEYDPAANEHHFWVYLKDKPHAPPPNTTNARTEMRLETFQSGERMFDGDVKVTPGTFACIAQVFDADTGPVTMVIAHPDGQVTVGHTVIATNVIGRWWNLKLTNDTREGGKINVYADDVLKGTFDSRGPRSYYFKCGVYARTGSDLSDVRYRNIKMWVKE